MKPNYYSVLPANIRYDNTLRPNEKILYSEITALSQKDGECYASNKYFAELYDVKENAIATWIKHLKEKSYIEIEYEYKGNTKEIQKRIIKLGGIQKDTTGYSKRYRGGIQKGEDNNTSINNIKKEYKERKFLKPTIEEIKEYCDERNNGISPNTFYDFYESKDWYVGKNKMKDWKASVRTWEQRTTKKIVPKWFDEEIKSSDLEDGQDFKDFIEDFRK